MRNTLKTTSLSLLVCTFFTACGAMLPYKENFSCEKGKENGVCGSVTQIYDLSYDMDELRKQADREYEKNHPELKDEAKVKALQNTENNFKTLKLQEMVEAVEIRKIQNETPTIFRYHLDDKEAKTMFGVAFIHEDDRENKAIKRAYQKEKSKSKRKSSQNNKKDLNAKADKKDKNALKNNENGNSKANSNLAASTQTNADDLNINDLYKDISFDKNESKNLNNTLSDLNQSLQTMTKITTFAETNSSQENLSNSINAVDCAPSNDSKIKPINGEVKVCVYHANIRENPSCKANVLRIAREGEVLEALYEQGGWIKLKDGTYVHKSIVTQD